MPNAAAATHTIMMMTRISVIPGTDKQTAGVCLSQKCVTRFYIMFAKANYNISNNWRIEIFSDVNI